MSDPRLKLISRQSGVTTRELARYLELELIPAPGDSVSDSTLRRVRRIRRLHRDLNIDLEIVSIIMRLLDRIQELEEQRPIRPQTIPRVISVRDKS